MAMKLFGICMSHCFCMESIKWPKHVNVDTLIIITWYDTQQILVIKFKSYHFAGVWCSPVCVCAHFLSLYFPLRCVSSFALLSSVCISLLRILPNQFLLLSTTLLTLLVIICNMCDIIVKHTKYFLAEKSDVDILQGFTSPNNYFICYLFHTIRIWPLYNASFSAYCTEHVTRKFTQARDCNVLIRVSPFGNYNYFNSK